jgi:hypothetical protein
MNNNIQSVLEFINDLTYQITRYLDEERGKPDIAAAREAARLARAICVAVLAGDVD